MNSGVFWNEENPPLYWKWFGSKRNDPWAKLNVIAYYAIEIIDYELQNEATPNLLGIFLIVYEVIFLDVINYKNPLIY